MSRRRGEFEHRTSIFEGAFRAWSHLGGLDPEDLEVKPTADLDPLTNPIQNDARLTNKKGKDMEPESFNLNGTKRQIYPYEPLPRSGLSHPYVQAILSPWLGPDADNDAIQLGLTTLRTWWQHRRKGESGSAIAALGTEKMKGVVEGYTRHFFALSHCLVMNDKEQPPRSLHSKMKDLEKTRSKMQKKKRSKEDEDASVGGAAIIGGNSASAVAADLTNDGLSPLERLHVAQQRNLALDGGANSAIGAVAGMGASLHPIHINNKCMPGNVDLPAIVESVNRQANQLAHSGSGTRPSNLPPSSVPSSVVSLSSNRPQYGDPNTFPVVFVTATGDILLAMTVDGITCAHCVKIVETVLKGCNGNKSPIDGLMDAAADRDLCSVLVKIDQISNAKRVAFEAARNLAMVGYTAKAKVISTTIDQDGGKKNKIPEENIIKAFDAVARTDPMAIFEWNISCSCPDNGVLRSDCSRHSQMSRSIFDAFENRGILARQYLAGSNIDPSPLVTQVIQEQEQQIRSRNQPQQFMNDPFNPQPIMQNLTAVGMRMDGTMVQNAGMDMYADGAAMVGNLNMAGSTGMGDGGDFIQRAQRNNSIISFGGGRAMSFGEASYGRAMSGLSALSIDWENMDDFDINVDHSAHINNGMNPAGASQTAGVLDPMDPKPIGTGTNRRRSSLRQFMVGSGGGANDDAHVSFKV